MFDRTRGISTCIVLVAAIAGLSAQPSVTGRITGRVADASTGEPLGFVNVRVDGTSLGAVSNETGEFDISSVPVGARTIYVSRIGFALASKGVMVDASGTQFVEVRLEQKAIEVAATEITADASQWRSNYAEFLKLLLGDTPNSRQCTIRNPEAIDLKARPDGSFHASSSTPVQIENRALGYVVDVAIGQFERSHDRLTTMLRTSFRELVPLDEEQSRKWKDQRRLAYFGSQRHFFRSLVARTLEEDGFTMFSLPSLNRPDVIRRQLQYSSILQPGPSQYQRTVLLSRYLEIEYSEAELPDKFPLRRRRDTEHQVSWLESNALNVVINQDGTIDQYLPFVTYGYWAWVRLGEQLPADYYPESTSH